MVGNCHMPGGGLVSKDVQIPNGRSNKCNAGVFKSLREPFVFRQESVSGMDRFDAILDANVDNFGNVQVLRDRRFVRIQFKRLIAFVPVLREAV